MGNLRGYKLRNFLLSFAQNLVRFSCYLRQNSVTINVSKFMVSTSRLFPHIRCCPVESGVNSPKFTQELLQIEGCEFRMKLVRNSHELLTSVVRILYAFVPLCTLWLSHSALIAFRFFIMLPTLSQQPSLQFGPDAAADTPVQYQALPIAH